MDEEKRRKERIIIAAGLAMIFVVFLVTFTRSSNQESAQPSEVPDETLEIKFDFPKISADDLEKKIISREKIMIIDVRTDDEYDRDHIRDSYHVGLDGILNFSQKAEIGSLVVIVGTTMEDANKAGNYLKNKGYQNISLLSGGISAWKNNNKSTVSWPDPTSFANQAKVKYLAADELKKNLDEGNAGIYILDVREPGFFNPHIPGAVNIDANLLEKRRKEIPINKEIIVYGGNELEGFQGGVIIHDLGFLSVSVLKGGFATWQEKNYPVEK